MESLKNNHASMKTEVETFFIEEVDELVYDTELLQEWTSLKTELGLTGQSEIQKDEKSPIPFMPIVLWQKNVIKQVCPNESEYNKFNHTPIPLEILRLIKLSINEGYFEKIIIHYDDITPDPFVVGYNFTSESDRASNYYWNMKGYLIGKWADVKQSWETLRERAAQRYVNETKASAIGQINYYKRQLDDIPLECLKKFGETSQNVNLEMPF